MPYLADLAPEILHCIIRYLIPHEKLERDEDLYSLARVSKRLYIVTEPFLYTKFVQVDRRSDEEFLRTLLEKPEYASRINFVHGYIFPEHDYYSSGPEDQSEEEDDDDYEGVDRSRNMELRPLNENIASIIKAIERLDIPSDSVLAREQWISAIRAKTEDACFTFAVLLLPNLKSLSIMFAEVDGGDTIFSSQVFHSAAQAPNTFLQNVEKISCICRRWGSMQICKTLSFIYIPSLRELVFRGLSEEDFDWERPFASHIEALDIQDSSINNAVWPRLLQPMHSLKRLGYSTADFERGGDIDYSLGGLSAGLQVVKHTLEYLYAHFYDLQDPNLLCTLRDFPNLREIDLQMSMLNGWSNNRSNSDLWEMLPPALEKASFSRHELLECLEANCRHGHWEQVMGLVTRSETHFPALRSIVLRSFYRPSKKTDLEPLKTICAAKCIALKMFDERGLEY